MQSEESIDRVNRNYGIFFILMAAVSLALAFHHHAMGQRGVAWVLAAGGVFFGVIGWWAIAGPILRRERGDEDDDGLAGGGRPVPIMPVPRHHLARPKVYLVVGKESRAPEKTHCLVLD